MRLPLLGLLLGLVSGIAALSTQGSKLLVVIEDDGDKSKYSHFWNDLEGMSTYSQSNTILCTDTHSSQRLPNNI